MSTRRPKHAARPSRARRSLRAAGLGAAVAGCLLAVGVARGWPVPFRDPGAPVSGPVADAVGGRGTATSEPQVGRAEPSPPGSRRSTTYTLVQMNLCLSGLAGCYEDAAYPAVVDEAVARIRALRPDAVTLTETCRGDVDEIARRVGYDARFAQVAYAGARLACVDPRGRGSFGNAVLTRAPVVGSGTEPFDAQSDLEERRWLCVSTRLGVDVCAAHLETPHTPAAADARNAQCAELAEVLAARGAAAFAFGGDVNRTEACAPPEAWWRTDSAADQAPGIQHVYGGGRLRDPDSTVLPARFSDHDVLVVHATLTPR